MEEKERYITEKGIEYLSQLQEKEKFKLDVRRNTLQNFLFLVVAIWVGLASIVFTIALSTKVFNWGLYIIGCIPIFIWFVYFIYTNYKMGKIEKDVQRIEKKIKEMYNKLGVDIDKLK